MAGFAIKAMEKQRENGLLKKPHTFASKNDFKNDKTIVLHLKKGFIKTVNYVKKHPIKTGVFFAFFMIFFKW